MIRQNVIVKSGQRDIKAAHIIGLTNTICHMFNVTLIASFIDMIWFFMSISWTLGSRVGNR